MVDLPHLRQAQAMLARAVAPHDSGLTPQE